MSNIYVAQTVGHISDYKYQIIADRHELLTFVDLMALKEEVDKLVSDEQSRLLQESLSGDYICDGCTI
ncbi:hypothetical protein PQC43_gp043 [Escherichia phage vB_EcoP-101114UKE3]|uniref:Uncharacterized protein n=1 Tax=Escherichia phage vB_EcoP-101114UKE3 TaxID=2865794 RepID=A0AAE8C345_9CAUD|nr:hypothetical protein PQC43_gp043 [Escherichia phage vB_EcoP-101114UKE3]QZI79174.1 hypothetical protein 101114UKE3_043 [Escherichia phage vB_EcoP-101114UKE3]USM81147.1 hypothetical protein 101114BS3_020 [Escherichia phage vB_EcoP-101114BS3]